MFALRTPNVSFGPLLKKICISKSLRIPTSHFISYHLDGEMVIKSTFTEQRRSGLSKLWGSPLLFQTLNHRALLYSKTRAGFEKISQKVWKTKPRNNTKLEDINIPVFSEQIHHQNSFVCRKIFMPQNLATDYYPKPFTPDQLLQNPILNTQATSKH